MQSTELKNLELVAKGKVRDIYAVDSDLADCHHRQDVCI